MNIEHLDFLSWFPKTSGSHEQDGEKLFSRAARQTASGDPAMAFVPSIYE
jgi:hypothetical protein